MSRRRAASVHSGSELKATRIPIAPPDFCDRPASPARRLTGLVTWHDRTLVNRISMDPFEAAERDMLLDHAV